MAALDFPNTPTVGQVFTDPAGGRSWIWTGVVWNAYGTGLATISASDGPPANPAPNQMWYESDTGKTYIFYDGFWVEISAPPSVVVPNAMPKGAIYHHQPTDASNPTTTAGSTIVPGFPGPVCRMTGGRAYRISASGFLSSANNYTMMRVRAQFTGSDTYGPYAMLLTQPTDMSMMPMEWYYTPAGATGDVDVTLGLYFGVYFGGAGSAAQLRNDLVQPFIHVDDIGLWVAPV